MPRNKQQAPARNKVPTVQFSHYVTIPLTDKAAEEIEAMYETANPMQLVQDLLDAGYSVTLKDDLFLPVSASAYQRNVEAADAGIGVSASANASYDAILALWYKVTVIAKYNLADVPEPSKGSPRFR